VAAGWFGAAVLAVLVGLAAISVIGAGLMSSSGTQPRSEAEVAREVAALPAPSPSPSSSLSSSPTASQSLGAGPIAPASKSFPTRAGTLVAACSAAGAEIISMAPDAGFAVHEQTRGAQLQAEGEFRGTGNDKDRVKITVTCSGGTPSMSVRDRRD
jgi:hypothetical protein